MTYDLSRDSPKVGTSIHMTDLMHVGGFCSILNSSCVLLWWLCLFCIYFKNVKGKYCQCSWKYNHSAWKVKINCFLWRQDSCVQMSGTPAFHKQQTDRVNLHENWWGEWVDVFWLTLQLDYTTAKHWLTLCLSKTTQVTISSLLFISFM